MRLFRPSIAAPVKATADSLNMPAMNDSAMPIAPSSVGSRVAGNVEIELGSGDGNSLGSNQLPSKTKKQELAHEQEEQKRTMRRAEQ